MARTRMTVNTDGLRRLAESFQSPAIQEALQRLPSDKAIAAIVAQAIEDNFDKQGPGWAPLKGATIRQSVQKKVFNAVKRQAIGRMRGVNSLSAVRKQGRVGEMHQVMDKIFVRHERKFSGTDLSNRAILEGTGTLKKSVTTPGAAHGVWPNQNSRFTLVWGTDLVYAAVHNYGYPKRRIPKREFLVIRDKWRDELNDYMVQRAIRIIRQALGTK